jgi:large subunit ribosomal protein L4
MAIDVPLINKSGESKGKFSLPVVPENGSKRVLHEVLVAYRRNQRQGTSDTKTRAEVSGGGHKPWRQKGTGNARSGSNRSPLWRKGGIIFGPHPRSYRTDVNEYKRRVALVTALSLKAQANNLSVLEAFPDSEGKTSVANKFLAKAVPSGRVLLVVDKKNELLCRAIGNVNRLSLMDSRELNPYALLASPKVLITKAAVDALESRFPQG